MTYTSTSNSGYFFEDNVDTLLYLVLSVIYPILVFFIELRQLDTNNVNDAYGVLTTGLFFTATFFYDFYSRFRSCDDKNPFIINVLFYGRCIFCALTIILLIIIIVMPYGWISATALKRGFYIIVVFSLYPFGMGVIEILKRVHNERKGKISRAMAGKKGGK